MLNKLIQFIIVLMFLVASVNAEDDKFMVQLYGPGNMSCGKYIEDITIDSKYSNVYTWWIAGFTTGANIAKKRYTQIDINGQVAWIKKYCQDNPLELFINASTALDKELDKRN